MYYICEFKQGSVIASVLVFTHLLCTPIRCCRTENWSSWPRQCACCTPAARRELGCSAQWYAHVLFVELMTWRCSSWTDALPGIPVKGALPAYLPKPLIQHRQALTHPASCTHDRVWCALAAKPQAKARPFSEAVSLLNTSWSIERLQECDMSTWPKLHDKDELAKVNVS